ncbi:MAG: Lrp/AsnC family transcriptional regulator [Kiloniellales bacterium]|nr:Lrp/AsnC family transcriptional regulator [Kiloniellales bacterium]
MEALDRSLLNDFQRDFPLTPRPFAAIAARLGVEEGAVLDALRQLQHDGKVSRLGAVVRTGAVGASTLAAMAVPQIRLESVADLVSAYPEVNHNYERAHRINLWFVVTADSRARVSQILAEIEAETGLAVLDLPMLEAYFLDLGFDLP